MCRQPLRLFVRDHLLHDIFHGHVRVAVLAQVAGTLGGLLGEDMALECVRSFDLAVLGEVESFLGAAMGLQLRYSGSPSV